MAITKISIISAGELDSALLRCWEDIQGGRSDLVSPCYHPEFTQTVAASRDDVRIAVLESDSRVVGFFPFQKASFGAIAPVGSLLNDYHGLIVANDASVCVPQILSACGSRYFGFDRMPLSQRAFAPFLRTRTGCARLMELGGGIEQYKARQLARPDRDSVNHFFRSIGRLRRKIERDIGPLRFEMHEPDQRAYEKLLQLKAAQFVRTLGERSNIFTQPWVRRVLDRIRHTEEPNFSGILSALYAGERLIACHFGMRSGGLLQGWFPTYDTTYSRYSPGLVLMMSIAEEADAHGVSIFDFGKGDQIYKLRFHTSIIPLGEGAVSIPAWAARVVMAKDNCCDYLKAGVVGDVLRAGKHLLNV